jgi:hypothetical protein
MDRSATLWPSISANCLSPPNRFPDPPATTIAEHLT